MNAPDPAQRLVAATREAAVARQRLSATVERLQARISPRTLAQKVAHEASDAGHLAVRSVADSADRNREAVLGALAALAVFFVGRPIVRRLRRRART